MLNTAQMSALTSSGYTLQVRSLTIHLLIPVQNINRHHNVLLKLLWKKSVKREGEALGPEPRGDRLPSVPETHPPQSLLEGEGLFTGWQLYQTSAGPGQGSSLCSSPSHYSGNKDLEKYVF